MTKAPVVTTDPSKERFDNLIVQVKDLFGTKRNDSTTTITENLTKRYEASKKAGHDQDFNDLVENIFTERKEALKQRENIVRKLAEIDLAQSYPEKADLKKWMESENKKSKKSPDELLSGDIKDDDIANEHLSIPNSNYRKQVMHAGFETRGFVEMNMARMKNLLENGSDISDGDKQKIGGKYIQGKFVEKMFQAGEAAHKLLKHVGKGTFTQTDAVDLNFTRAYNQRREALAQELRSKLDMSCSNYANMLNKMMARINASDENLDAASYAKMKDLIESEIKQDAEDYKVRMDKLNSDLKDQEGDMLKEMQGHADKSDDMLKYRLISMFLVFTPFGAFAALGPFSQYLDFLSDILGPILEANKTLGGGLADAVTSDQFGFLGDLMHDMKVDEFIRLVFDKAPVFHQFSEVFDALTDNDIAQGLMAEGAPMLGSPLVYAAIGAYVALGRAPEELKHNKDIQDTKAKYMGKTEVGFFPGEDNTFLKRSDGALKKLFKDVENDVNNGWEKELDDKSKKKFDGTNARISRLVEKRYGKDKEVGILEEAYIDKKMCEFFVNNADRVGRENLVEAVFGKKAVQDFSDGKMNNPEGYVSPQDFVKYLDASGAAKKSAREKFLLLAGFDTNVIENGLLGKDPNAVSSRIADASKAGENKTLQEQAQTKLTQNFYFEIAKQKGISGYSKDKDGAAAIKKKVMADEVVSLKQDLVEFKTLPPRTETSPLSARGLSGKDVPTFHSPMVDSSHSSAVLVV